MFVENLTFLDLLRLFRMAYLPKRNSRSEPQKRSRASRGSEPMHILQHQYYAFFLGVQEWRYVRAELRRRVPRLFYQKNRQLLLESFRYLRQKAHNLANKGLSYIRS